MLKKVIVILMTLALLFALIACAADEPATPAVPADQEQDADEEDAGAEAPGEGGNGPEPVTIRVFTNLPDRTSGQGLIEQMLIDAFMVEYPHVTIEVEALQDEDYKLMFTVFAAGGEMPDFVSGWGFPSFLDEVLDAGLIAELDPADYVDYGFIEGTKAGFMRDGRLYGLPRNTDIIGFYYNEAVFEEHGWTVPETFEELIELSGAIREAGLQPVSTNGGDGWPLSLFFNNMLAQIHGPGIMELQNGLIASGDWNHPVVLETATLFQEAALAGLFANGFESADYGGAQALFTSGQAALYWMGGWETGMATNETLPEDFRENLRAFKMPAIDGAAGTIYDVAAWNGGGYFVTANSPVRDYAIKLLNFFFRPDNWNRLTWEHGVTMSAQDFTQYFTGDETPVQLQFVEFFQNSHSVSGPPAIDLGTAEFKVTAESLIIDLAIGLLTPQEWIDAMSEASSN